MIVVAGHLAIFDFGLRDSGLKIDIPHGGRLIRVDVTFAVQVEEAQVRGAAAAIVDRGILLTPVHGETNASPQGLNACSSSAVSRRHSSMKFGREILRGGPSSFPAAAGGSKFPT